MTQLHEQSGVFRVLNDDGTVFAEFNPTTDTWKVTDIDGVLRTVERGKVGDDGYGVLRIQGPAGDPPARSFDGASDWVYYGGAGLPTDLFANDFTLSVDVVVPENTTNQYFLQRGNAVDKLTLIQSTFGLAVGTTSGWAYIGPEVMQVGVYTIQYDTAETGFARWKAWLDGVSKTMTTTTGTHNDITAGAEDLNLGRRMTGVNHMFMTIRDFRIYSALKTPGEVTADDGTDSDLELWWRMIDAQTSSLALDWSINGRHGIYRGTISV